jgi:hypothetical protein
MVSGASRRLRRTLALVLLCVPLASCRAAPGFVERDEWAAIFMGNAKIGYAHFKTGPERDWQRPGVVRMSIEVTARLAEMGVPTQMDISITQWIDGKTGRPIRVQALLPSGREPTRKVVDFGATTVTSVRTSYDGERTSDVPIPDGAVLQGELQFLLDPPKAGEVAGSFYNILSDELQPVTTRTTAKDGGGWTVEGAFSGGAYTIELDADGRFVRGRGLMGIRFEAQPEAQARDLGAGDYVPPLELGIGAKVEKPLPPPERVRKLELILRGLSLAGGPPRIAGRQTVAAEGDSYRVTVTADDIRRHRGPERGYKASPEAEADRGPDRFVTSGDAAIVAAAGAAAGDERDASRVAERLCAWVDGKLAFGGAIDSARTAGEILSSARGVCRDYAVLYAAMARAASIPTRLCTGLVYARDGFYLHTWAESWLGEANGWVPLDPTRSGAPVDATHVTLIRGNAESVWKIMRIVGDVQITVAGCDAEAASAAPPLPLPFPFGG